MRLSVIMVLLWACAPVRAVAVVCGGPDECERVCARGGAAACLRFGDLAAAGDAEVDPEAAAPAWGAACRLGSGLGCHRIACVLRRDGQGEEARRHLRRGCELGHAASCGDGAGERCVVPPRPEWRDLRAEDAACAAGDAVACFRAGERMEDGRDGAADVEGARRRYAAACEGGVAAACLRAGEAARAVGIYRARCEAGWRGACESLLALAGSGVFMAGDAELASWARERACALGAADRCE